jgi:hypothetical protein
MEPTLAARKHAANDGPSVKLCPYCKSTHPISFDNAIRMRRWNKLEFECPHCILVEEFPLMMGPGGRPFVGNLPPDAPKERFERQHGSVLAYGLMNQNVHRIGFNVAFGTGLDPTVEDCVLRYRHDRVVHTFPVQLKRVTRDDMDPHDELNLRISELAKYQVDDLIAGISIERTFRLEWKRVVVPKMRIFELWLIRAGSRDGIKWGMHGFTPWNPSGWKCLEFVYPSILPKESTLHLD